MDLTAAAAGFVVGVLVGMTGVGSGSLMAPFLVLVLGNRPVIAVGTDLAYAAITKVFGGIRHAQQGTVDRGLALRLAVGSVPGSVIGVAVVGLLEAQSRELADAIVGRALGVTLLLVALVIFVEPLLGRRWRGHARLEQRGTALVVLGFVVGLVVGLTSLGSGSLLGAALVLLTGLPARRIVGTDVLHGALLTGSAALAHLVLGHVDVPLTLALLVGSIPGVLLGAQLASKVNDSLLRRILGIVLLIAGARML